MTESISLKSYVDSILNRNKLEKELLSFVRELICVTYLFKRNNKKVPFVIRKIDNRSYPTSLCSIKRHSKDKSKLIIRFKCDYSFVVSSVTIPEYWLEDTKKIVRILNLQAEGLYCEESLT